MCDLQIHLALVRVVPEGACVDVTPEEDQIEDRGMRETLGLFFRSPSEDVVCIYWLIVLAAELRRVSADLAHTIDGEDVRLTERRGISSHLA